MVSLHISDFKSGVEPFQVVASHTSQEAASQVFDKCPSRSCTRLWLRLNSRQRHSLLPSKQPCSTPLPLMHSPLKTTQLHRTCRNCLSAPLTMEPFQLQFSASRRAMMCHQIRNTYDNSGRA